MFDKREILFGQKDGWGINGINQWTDVNSNWNRAALKHKHLKPAIWKYLIFKNLCKVLLKNSGICQCDYNYSFII